MTSDISSSTASTPPPSGSASTPTSTPPSASTPPPSPSASTPTPTSGSTSTASTSLGWGICVACHGDLSEDNTCQRCHADNKRWIKWKEKGPDNSSRSVQLKWYLRSFWLDVAFLAACLVIVGLASLPILLKLWQGFGLLFFAVSVVLSIGAAYEQWRRREDERQAAKLKEVVSALVNEPGWRIPNLPVVFWLLILGAVVSTLGPLLFLSLPRLGLGELPKPLPVRDLFYAYLAMLYMHCLTIGGWAWGRYALLRVYANRADPQAPPFVFTHPTKFLNLAQADIKEHLPDKESEKVLNWGDLKRRRDGGMDLEVTVDKGKEAAFRLLNGKYTTMPLEKTYLVRLDKWARVVEMTQQKKE